MTTIDYTNFITDCYVNYLGRAPSADEIVWYNNALNNGTTEDQVIADFKASPEYAVQNAVLGATATDVANRTVTRQAQNVSGGQAGYVNGASRNVDNVGAGDTSFEWAQTNILNSAAPAGTENVAGYNQANGTGTGEMWGGVDQVTQAQDAPAVGLEIDVKKPVGNADGLALDLVNEGGETAEIQGGDGEVIWRNRAYNGLNGQPLSCIRSTAGGGFEIVVRGNVVANWP